MKIIDQHTALAAQETALVPVSSLLDGRTEVDCLAFLSHFASLINFYDNDNNIHGNWTPFLLKDLAILLARQAFILNFFTEEKMSPFRKAKLVRLQPKTEIIKRKNPEFMINQPEEIFEGIIPVKNAGLVLINHNIPLLFERLNLIDDNKVFLPEKQAAAIHYLQFLATGQLETDEPDLALNKVLCGIPLRKSITNQTVISHAEIELMTQLLQAVIGYWTAIGSSSIDGFRGNWLIRDGLLSEQDDRWELLIERRVYDILINQSPFSFSVIKYPWMIKPLYVQWPY
ncbi:contractile injection system tape measure protein [Pedobacter sp. N23S346]|uniref:contractile injection system tape measure protein n=1 Tax=Pedobacter sp. N23S346 TaxID=3402750 RepID=UPI003AD0FB53